MEVMHASYYGIEAGDNNTFIKVRSHDHGNDPQTLCRGNPATAGGQCHGFYTHDLNNVFDGVESYNNNGQGIALTLGSASVTVKNSKLHDNTGMAIQFAYAWTNHLIFNNLIYNNGSGFAVFASDSSQFYNNTIVGNGSCIDLVTDENGNGSDNNTLRNNICYQNGSTIFDQGSGNVQSNNLTTNPNFVNASNGDFHITSNSPARDAGTALSQVPCDHDGNARPAGSAYDIGAYEYGSSPGRRMFRLNIITDPHTSSVRCYLYAIHEQQPDTPRVWSPLGRDEPERDAGERELHPTHVIAQSGGPEYDEDGVCIQDGVCSPEWSIKLESGGPLRFPAAIRGMVSLISPGSDEYS